MQEKEDWGCCYKDCNIQILAAAAPWGRKKSHSTFLDCRQRSQSRTWVSSFLIGTCHQYMYIRSGSKFACKQKVCHEKKEPFEETDSDLEASLDGSSRYLDDKWEANASTNLIKRQIEQINKRLSQVEKETLIIEADTSKVFENHIKIYFCFWYLNFYSQIPMHVFIQTFFKKKKYDLKNGNFQTLCPGYDCTNEIMDIKEVSFTDQIRCYNTTKEVRSTYVTHIIVFESCTYSESMCRTFKKMLDWRCRWLNI